MTIYSIVPTGTLADKKYQLLTDKSAAADLALDGQLVDEEDEPIDWAKQVKELRAMGLAISTDDTIDEDDIKALWETAEGPYERLLPPAAPASPPGQKVPVLAGPVESEPETEDKPFAPFEFTIGEEEDNGQLGFDF